MTKPTAFVFNPHARATPPGHASSVEHHHTGGPRAQSTRPRSEHAPTTRPDAYAPPDGSVPEPSDQTHKPAPPSSPPPSRCSDATIPDSPIPIHTGCGPPGVRNASPPTESACGPANAPQSHADTAPTRITIVRRCTAQTVRTTIPPDLRYNQPTARGAATTAEKHPLNLIRLAPAEGMQTVITSTQTDRLPRRPHGASTLRTTRHG